MEAESHTLVNVSQFVNLIMKEILLLATLLLIVFGVPAAGQGLCVGPGCTQIRFDTKFETQVCFTVQRS